MQSRNNTRGRVIALQSPLICGCQSNSAILHHDPRDNPKRSCGLMQHNPTHISMGGCTLIQGELHAGLTSAITTLLLFCVSEKGLLTYRGWDDTNVMWLLRIISRLPIVWDIANKRKERKNFMSTCQKSRIWNTIICLLRAPPYKS